MSDQQQAVVSAFVFSVVALFLALMAGHAVFRFWQRSREAMFRLDRWERAMKDHLHWFGHSDPMMLAVLENIQRFAGTARPLEMSKSEAFELYTELWRKRAREISKVFKNLAGREMEEMTDHELKSFMVGLAIDRGPQSNDFRSALTWLIHERRDYLAQLHDANRAVEQALLSFNTKDATILNLTEQVREAKERLNSLAQDIVALKKELEA